METKMSSEPMVPADPAGESAGESAAELATDPAAGSAAERADAPEDEASVRLALAVYLGFGYLIAGSLWLGAHPSDSSLFSVLGVIRFLVTIFGWPLFALGLLDG